MDVAYSPYLILLSIGVAVLASYVALNLANSITHAKGKAHAAWLIGGSLAIGVGIWSMHFIGMLAFEMPDMKMAYDIPLMVLSVIVAVVASMLALYVVSRAVVDPESVGWGGVALAASVVQRVFLNRQKYSEDILVKSEEKYRVLVEAVKDYAIFMLDPNGYITTWNLGAERITGYSLSEIVGRHVSTLYTTADASSDVAYNELTTVLRTGHFEGEAIRKKKDGSTFWANIVLDPLLDKDGRLTGFSKVVRDITEFRKAAERTRSLNEELEKRVQERTLALQEREAQLRIITNAMPVMVAQLDKHERFMFANNFFCDWFHRSQDDIMRETFQDVLGSERYPDNKPYIDKALAGETVTYERNSRSGDRQAILNITFVPEFDSQNLVEGFIVVAADVSSYKKIEAELKTAKEEAEVANETKSAFLANMSHEIRTPLGAVIGFSELMADENMSASERANTIEIIKRNGRLLSTIINDILDISKVEAGKMEIERVPVKLMETVNDIAVLLNLEASGKGIQLNVSSEGKIPNTVATDPTRLRQILFNIVGNAIKFTKKGSVNLTVKTSEDTSKIEFVVRDTGAGIAKEQAERLFSPFTQADITTTRKFGGTGLGLVLSKKLASALGGDVLLKESEPGKGSTFIISIQHGQINSNDFVESRAEEVAPKAKAPITTQNAMELAGKNILAVDDSADNLALIKWILKMSGANVITANNGHEGITKASKDNVDIVLMDLQMPEMDGYEATRELRKQGFKKPIIALTAHAMKEERKRCLENGFDEHITKPIDKNNLIQILSELPK